MVGGIEKDIIIEMWKIVNLESVRELIEKKSLSVFFMFSGNKARINTQEIVLLGEDFLFWYEHVCKM